MTELGLAFDDDDLDTQKKKNNKDRDLPYHVKIVEPRWFDGANDCSDQEPQVLKFRGDYRYRLKNYAEAAHQYRAALDILPENNVAVGQDIRESLARCYSFMGNHIESVKISEDLAKEMSLEDEARQRQSLILHAFVCEKACLWEECVLSLQKLCLLQPNFPQTWFQLGEAMSKLYQVPVPSIRKETQASGDTSKRSDCTSSIISHSSEGAISRDKDPEKEKNLFLTFMCYTRAKLMFESVMRNANDIIKMRNQKIIAEISEKLENLPLSNELRQKSIEVGSMEDHEDSCEHQNIFKDGNISDLFYSRFFKRHKKI
ncbi:hypothetical protein EGW08_016009 [Elysia chlorotica]|uniref:Uncharacterized protein n=1 Tax=Elysia chlorotica TaxID=188477 RepID=A0A3S0ZF85_ELYCH|nr:hypothetical protein EGW08_016009 [Elysia chlorotica]